MTAAIRAGACLSLTGRFAQFGRQAEQGLRLWAESCGVDLAVVDDESDTAVLNDRLGGVAPNVDLLFGPYSTVLMRSAVAFAQRRGMLLFNHGGSGGRLDIPGRVVNVLTPADRYAEPFVTLLAKSGSERLFTYCESGVFGRQVTGGAGRDARSAGIDVEYLNFDRPPTGPWDLLTAGVYEDDVAAVNRAQALPNPPRLVCSVAAGVGSFADDADNPEGVYGLGQWALGAEHAVDEGMGHAEFLAAWRRRFGAAPDYPGVQAYAAGIIASKALEMAGSAHPLPLWSAVSAMDCTTVFGWFQIDPQTGVQVGHDGALTQWRGSVQVVIAAG